MIKPTPNPPIRLFTVADGISTEDLMVNLSETLASANALSCDLAFNLEGSKREELLGVAQLIDLAQLGEGGRADVRAEGVAKEQQAPLALQLVNHNRLAVLVCHGHRRQLATLRQQDNAGVDQCSGFTLAFATEYFVDGQAHDQRDDGHQDKDGFLSSGHRFNNR